MVKSPVRENRPPGSVRGAPGNRRPYRDPLARPAGKSALRQPEALFSFTRPIGWVGSSVVEQRPFKPLVVGSNPTRPTSLKPQQTSIKQRQHYSDTL